MASATVTVRRHTMGALSTGLLLLLSLVALSGCTTRDEYCRLCGDHTMCLYSGVSEACTAGRWEHGVPAADQNAVVDAHNRLRNIVALGQELRGAPGPQPPASNMQRMVWDDEVAQVAQRWADQCNYKHDACRSVPRYYVGQNLALKSQWPCSSMNSTQEWAAVTQSWYDEVAKFDKNTVGNFQGATGVGHYTQVVWAKSNRLGCGYALFQDGDWCRKYYVCNYGPGGNYLGQPVYQVGTARTACPSVTTLDPRYPGLC